MTGGQTLVVIALQSFLACLALSPQESLSPCFDASGVCTASAEVISMLDEDSSIDHLSYVQIKAAKVGDLQPDNQIQQALEKASNGEHPHPDNPNGYNPPPPDESGGTWQEVKKAKEAEEHPFAHGDDVVPENRYVPLQWAYEPKDHGVKGPSQWGELEDSACGAGLQSPIDISTEGTMIHPELTVHDLELQKDTTECDAESGYLLNAHTTVRLYEGNCSVTFKAIWKEKVYYMVSFHYSSPSEHTIDGAYYPMEVQHVHKAADDDQKLIIAVAISTLIGDQQFNSQDKMAARFLSGTLKHMPKVSPGKNRFERHFTSEMWDPYQEFLKGHLGGGFWHYVGSTTSPPCQPDTIWMLDPVPIKVPITLIGKYRKLINSVPDNGLATFGSITGMGPGAVPKWADDSGMFENGWNAKLGCNNRPTQPMNGRALWGINVTVPKLTTAEPLPGDAEFAGAKE